MLPLTKSTIKSDFKTTKTIIVGAPKTGKSTFASQLGEDVLFLSTEDGLDFLSVFKIDVRTYKDFADAVTELTTKTHNFKTICIDVMDKLIEIIENEVCARNKVTTMAQILYGAGQIAARKMLFADLEKLNDAGLGLIMTTHQKEKEFKTDAISWTAMSTSLGKSYEEQILGYCDLIFYVYANSAGKRMLRTKPSKYIQAAGDRSNKLPEVMELDAKSVIELLKKPKTETVAASVVTKTN